MPDAAPELPITLPTRPKSCPRFQLVAVVNLSEPNLLACAKPIGGFPPPPAPAQTRRLLDFSLPSRCLVLNSFASWMLTFGRRPYRAKRWSKRPLTFGMALFYTAFCVTSCTANSPTATMSPSPPSIAAPSLEPGPAVAAVQSPPVESPLQKADRLLSETENDPQKGLTTGSLKQRKHHGFHAYGLQSRRSSARTLSRLPRTRPLTSGFFQSMTFDFSSVRLDL